MWLRASMKAGKNIYAFATPRVVAPSVPVDSSGRDGVALDDEFLVKAKTVLEAAGLPLRMALEGPGVVMVIPAQSGLVG